MYNPMTAMSKQLRKFVSDIQNIPDEAVLRLDHACKNAASNIREAKNNVTLFPSRLREEIKSEKYKAAYLKAALLGTFTAVAAPSLKFVATPYLEEFATSPLTHASVYLALGVILGKITFNELKTIKNKSNAPAATHSAFVAAILITSLSLVTPNLDSIEKATNALIEKSGFAPHDLKERAWKEYCPAISKYVNNTDGSGSVTCPAPE